MASKEVRNHGSVDSSIPHHDRQGRSSWGIEGRTSAHRAFYEAVKLALEKMPGQAASSKPDPAGG